MTSINDEISLIEDEEVVRVIVEPPKKKEIDPLDVDGGEVKEEEEPVEQIEEGEKPAFKPENYDGWTSYDGIPRNYIQTLLRLKKYPLDGGEVHKNEAHIEILRAVSDHIKNRNEGIIQGQLNGNITLIKLMDN